MNELFINNICKDKQQLYKDAIRAFIETLRELGNDYKNAIVVSRGLDKDRNWFIKFTIVEGKEKDNETNNK